ncbi:hypothetical protein [Mariniflexile sp.]|uniref:hypothetical protein n=1 Tax=Mariniflexile sp. TaxID=1979402 RepID=UPI0040482AAF
MKTIFRILLNGYLKGFPGFHPYSGSLVETIFAIGGIPKKGKFVVHPKPFSFKFLPTSMNMGYGVCLPALRYELASNSGFVSGSYIIFDSNSVK